MYKVKNSDVIFRTHEQVVKMDKSDLKMIGCKKGDEGKIRELDSRLSTLTEKVGGDNHTEIVEIIYSLLDLMNGHTKKMSVCQLGCSHCCRVGVDLSLVEAIYISKKTGFELGDPDPAYKHTKDEYCVFHDDETASCSIYEFRPAHCRIFFAFDSPVFCDDVNGVHAISTENGMSPDPYVNHLMQYLLSCGENKFADVRAWFPEKNVPVLK